jgi:hypothetical protein
MESVGFTRGCPRSLFAFLAAQTPQPGGPSFTK